MRNSATGVLALAFAMGIGSAWADPAVKPKDMATALSLANTQLKKCLTQSALQGDGSALLTDADLKSARNADSAAEDTFVSRFAAATSQLQPTQPQSQTDLLTSLLMGASSASAPAIQTGMKFSLGLGYTSDSQYWLQALNGGDPKRAATLLAYDSATEKLLSGKAKKDPQALADADLAKSVGVLGLAERATLDLSYGNIDCAVQFLDFAAQRSDVEQGSFWGSDLEGYEHIMLLNMKAMAYLLAGDERARNMVQASRDLQSAVREKYAAELDKAKAEAEKQSQTEALPNQAGWLGEFDAAFQATALRENAQVAGRVATPYVNPLADYLSGVLSETEALSGSGSLDEFSRSSIGWTNAAKLAPQSSFLKAAAADARKWQTAGAPKGAKVVNVLVGAGSAPQKAVTSMYFNYEGKPFPVMLPITTPQPTAVRPEQGRVSVGGKSASLELVSDIEGMAVRHAEDERGAEMLAALVRGWVAFRAGEAAGANSSNAFVNILGSAVRDALAEPSTDAWLSLPKGYYAARIVAPASATEVTVSVPGAGESTFQLAEGPSTFIYATAKDSGLWGVAQQAVFGGGQVDFQAK